MFRQPKLHTTEDHAQRGNTKAQGGYLIACPTEPIAVAKQNGKYACKRNARNDPSLTTHPLYFAFIRIVA